MVALPGADEPMGMCYPSGRNNHMWLGSILDESIRLQNTCSRDFQLGRIPSGGMMEENFLQSSQEYLSGNRGQKNDVWALHFECDVKDVPVVMP